MRYIFTGGSDGLIRKFDLFSTMNSLQKLSQNQMNSVSDTITKGAVMIACWENDESSNLPEEEDEEEFADIVNYLTKTRLSPVYSLVVNRNSLWCLSGMKVFQ
jgi:transcriptional activator SPT8